MFEITFHVGLEARPVPVVAASTRLQSHVASAPVAFLPIREVSGGKGEQKLYANKDRTSGMYTLTINGSTVSVDVAADRMALQTALQTVVATAVVAGGDGSDADPFVIQYDAPTAAGITAVDVAMLRIDVDAAVATTNVQTAGRDGVGSRHTLTFANPSAGDMFTLTIGSTTTDAIAWNADPVTLITHVKDAFSAKFTMNPSANPLIDVTDGTDALVLEFTPTTTGSLTVAYTRAMGSMGAASAALLSAAVAPRSEVQRVYHAGTNGTFTLSLGTKTTDPIAWNVSATDLKTALEDPNSTNVQVTVTGTGSRMDPWLITFSETGPQDQLRIDAGLLTYQAAATSLVVVEQTPSSTPQTAVQTLNSRLPRTGTFTLVYGGKVGSRGMER